MKVRTQGALPAAILLALLPTACSGPPDAEKTTVAIEPTTRPDPGGDDGDRDPPSSLPGGVTLPPGISITAGDCSPVLNNVRSKAGVVVNVICNQPTEEKIIQELFSDWQSVCFVSAPKPWRIIEGSPEMSLKIHPDSGSYFAQFDFSFDVTFHSRAIDVDKYGDPEAPRFFVERTNMDSEACDLENRTHTLTRGGLNYPEPLDTFYEDGKVPVADWTIPFVVRLHYEDGQDEGPCELPVFKDENYQSGAVSLDNVIHAYPERGEEFSFLRLSCTADSRLRRSSFDRMCRALIEKFTREPDFNPDACLSVEGGFVWPRESPTPEPINWSTSPTTLAEMGGLGESAECSCLMLNNGLDIGTPYSRVERLANDLLDVDARYCDDEIRLIVAASDRVLPNSENTDLDVASVRVAGGDHRRYQLGGRGIALIHVDGCPNDSEE